jgi:hypothetical protein
MRCLTKLVHKSLDGVPEHHTDNVGDGHDYTWFEMDFFSHWKATRQCRLLCIGTPKVFQASLYAHLQELLPLNMVDMCAMIRVAVCHGARKDP